jgi:hypothetical protein
MHPQRVAGLCLWIVVSSVAVAAQQRSDTAGTSPTSPTTVTEQTYAGGNVLPLRRVERRTESGGRKVIIETVEAPSLEGRWEPLEEDVTDTARVGSASTRTQRDVFYFAAERQRKLAATTQSEEETRPNAVTTNVERTWVADLDGHLILSTGYSEQRRLVSPGLQQTEATLLLQGPERSLREVERTESTDHRVSSTDVRHDSTHFVRDVLNGRWVPVEARSGQTRGAEPTERVDEQTVQRPNLNGTLVLSDKVVTRTSEANRENRVVIETYSQDAEGFVRNDNHLALRQRVSRSTTVTTDGGRSTVEEVEARTPNAPSDPMRMIRRIVVTVRSVGPGRSVTERQMFERDTNGRMVLVANDTEETTDK